MLKSQNMVEELLQNWIYLQNYHSLAPMFKSKNEVLQIRFTL